MGLDQYAYTAARSGQYNEYYEAEGEYIKGEWVVPNLSKPREIAYWRKHPNLQGWMEKLWIRKLEKQGKVPEKSSWGSSFNGVELELTWEDLDELERAVTHNQLPQTSGFFFGDCNDEYYRKHDLEFIKNARAELFLGLKVFYNSSW